MDAYEFAKRFSELLKAARASGKLEPLSHYQRRFPGFEGPIAREYEIVARDSKRPPSSGAIPRDWVPAAERDHYKRLGEIARGGMGAILRVRDETLGRDLAMKVVLGDGGRVDTSSPGGHGALARRFLEEARITAQLDHPGVVPVHELGADGEGRLFFTMKLIEGGRTLADVFRLAREGDAAFGRNRVVEVLIRVLETLAFAHEKGVIHRDLKPANVMVGNFGEVYVMDWGLAKSTSAPDAASDAALAAAAPAPEDGDSAGGLTAVGQVLGTPDYMPLEQARGEPLDARADIYSVGAMLYEFVAGVHPCGEKGRRKSAPEVLHRLLNEGPVPLGDLAPDAPPELLSIVGRAMAREKAGRYASAMEFAGDLRNFVEGRVVAAHETGTWAELRKWIGRNRALSAASAAAVAALLAGLVAFALENRTARENARIAGENAVEANRQKAIAETSERGMAVAKADAEDHAKRMTRLAYASLIGRASAAISQGDGRPAIQLLEQCPKELRGWEWDMLARRTAGAKPTGAVGAPPAYYQSVALVPGGRMALCGGPAPNSWIVWDLKANRMVGRKELPDHAPEWIAFSPDGERFVTTGIADETVCLWETSSGRLLARSAGKAATDGTAQAAVFSPDGRLIAAGGAGGVEILDAATLARRAAFADVDGFGLGWSPDGRRVVATQCSSGGEVSRAAVLFDVGTGAVVARGPAVRRSRIVSFSPDGTRVLLPISTGESDTASQVGVFDAATLQRVAVLDVWRGGGFSYVNAAAWDATGVLVATMASNDSRGLLRVFDTVRYVPVGETSMLQHANAVEFSADGGRIRAGSCFGSFWDLDVADLAERVAVPAEEGVEDRQPFVEFTDGGSKLALGGRLGTVRSLDLATGVAREAAAGVGAVHRLAATDAADAVFAATESGIWEIGLAAGARPSRRNESPLSFSSVAISSDGRLLAGGTGDFVQGSRSGGEIRVWDRTDGSSRSERAFDTDVAGLDFQPGAAALAAISSGTSADGHEVGVYDCARGEWRWRTREGDGAGRAAIGRCVAFDPRGAVVYTGGFGDVITARDAGTGNVVASKQVATAGIRDIRPSSDGARLYVITMDHFLYVLEPASLETFDTIDIGGQGTNRDSEGWGLSVHGGGDARVAVTRQLGNLLVLDPKWTTASVRAFAADRRLLPGLAARQERLGFSGLVLDELYAAGTDPAALENCRRLLRAMDEAKRLSADAWEAVRFDTGDGRSVDAAVRRMERCVELEPDDQAALSALGVAFYRAHRYDLAIKTLERSTTGNRRGGADSPTDSIFLAMALHRNGETEKASALLLGARRQLTDNLAAWIGTSPRSDVLRDELMRQWAEAERLLHGELPPEFTYDLSRVPLAAPR